MQKVLHSSLVIICSKLRILPDKYNFETDSGELKIILVAIPDLREAKSLINVSNGSEEIIL